MGLGAFLKVVAQNIDVLAGPIVTLVYPLYASVKAIESPSRVDDQQWLTYWVLYSMITLFEMTFYKAIAWFPFWSYAKLIAICWLVLPYFNGAAYVYEHYIRPCFVNPRQVNIWFFPGKKNALNNISDDARLALEKYLAENGPESFEKLLRKAEMEIKPNRSSLSIFDENYRY
ncbi:hypothetical protein AMTRI_Chr04g252790 [Amborella trichopoda]|uniref:HVA22-like protein n=1 Tax=Amborella trichopoda TaxID=13333 RepID=W1NG12_AMBTC|nr:HVA22-like protein a [Amborella trichopoda]ERM94426.1 hypothetical protein AMTR_s00010p00257430 [Amborella trichopoda]|eukprot:XP_006827189.1 HVA22-like protein a [Amborella trichopoda]